MSPIAQLAARLAVNQEVRGSKPRRGASSVCSRVAQWQSSVLIRRGPVDRSHPRVPVSARCGADGSARDLGSRGRRFETCHRDQIVRALGCGRSSMEEPWAVNPLVPVRLRPVTPKRICIHASRTRVAENRALTPDGQGSSPWRRTTQQPPRGGIGRRTGFRSRRRRACPFDSDRGDQPAVR